MSAQTYRVGVHFKALTKGILVAATKTLENFFHFKCLGGAVFYEHFVNKFD